MDQEASPIQTQLNDCVQASHQTWELKDLDAHYCRKRLL